MVEPVGYAKDLYDQRKGDHQLIDNQAQNLRKSAERKSRTGYGFFFGGLATIAPGVIFVVQECAKNAESLSGGKVVGSFILMFGGLSAAANGTSKIESADEDEKNAERTEALSRFAKLHPDIHPDEILQLFHEIS